MDFSKIVSKRLDESGATIEQLADSQETLVKISEILIRKFRADQTVYFFGNGGSAADAQHIAAELSGRYYLDRPSLPASSLTVNTSSLTAIGNDYSFDEIFARQIDGIGKEGDVAIGISTSGNSANVLNAVETANKNGLVSIGFTGQNGGTLRNIVDTCLRVPSTDTP
jgi:D-sedoheptulose 7-phosphate isomerase